MSTLSKAAAVIVRGVQEKLGLDATAMVYAQVFCVAEEAGEFVGAFRRWNGMARRDGSLEDVKHELADVVISSYTAAAAIGFDLDAAINEKLDVVMTRGWKQEASA